MFWAPFVLLTVLLAVLGYRYGGLRQGLTETDAINFYAQRYLQQHAEAQMPGTAAPTDCFATPGRGVWVWLVLTCQPTASTPDRLFRYEINWLGGLVCESGPDTATPLAPQT
ncbi:hypothetical protein [Phaeobacter sp.]|uniref:hypothetical protein n=1 Tax=Phaeobacter sp. TaxID=1902409 RepID=UPI0025D2FFBD|nr:hypothetical protein [Phaeobacter sp.]